MSPRLYARRQGSYYEVSVLAMLSYAHCLLAHLLISNTIVVFMMCRLKWHSTLPLIYTSASDGVMRLWDARAGTLLRKFTGHIDVINDMVLKCGSIETGEPDVVVTAGEDKSFRGFTVHSRSIHGN